ncbi:putative ABC transporter substrate-binding protein YesO [Spirochaetia bacterium]|nr:putative ABC transporter substrate-binding protein YesO [Spirochaetia bacterium]GHV54144.1 putative ABC transporter substrate-binding protein YesO [Spirochaetia bacterium]
MALLAVALVFTGCKKKADETAGGGGGNYLRLAWWGNTVRDERTNAVAKLFESKNPGVTVETEATAWDGYWSKLNTQAASGSLPDIMQQDYAYINQWFNRDLLEDLTPYSQKGTIDLSKWADSAVAAGKINGKLIALNLGTNSWGMGIDPAVVQQAGVTIDDINWTWEDFEKIALTIYQKTGVQTQPFSAHKQLVEHRVRERGGSYYAADGKGVGWTNLAAEVKELLDINLRLKAAGALFDPEEAFLTVTMEEEPFSRGKTWNSYYWSNQHVGHINAAKRPIEYIINPSVGPSRTQFGAYLKPSQFVSMLSNSKDKELAARFINFFINDLEANSVLLAERGVPVPTDVRDHLAPKVDVNMKYLFDYIGKITPYTSPIDPPDPARAGETEDAFKEIFLQTLTGQISSQAATERMIQRGKEILGS